MKMRFLLILVAFVSWSVACNWYYMCKIKNLCGEGSAPVYSSLAQSAPPAGTETLDKTPEASSEVPVEIEAENTADSEGSIEPEPSAQPASTSVPAMEYSIHFELASSQMIQKNELDQVLSDIKSRMNQEMLEKIVLTGHTCDLGNEDFNYRLGLQRARAVKRQLTALGIPDSKIEVGSKGEGSPLNSNTSEIDRSQNRRTEITIK